MSKIISIILSLIAYIASILGINMGNNTPVEPDIISYNSAKTEATVSLSENPSTGYKWEYNIINEYIAKVSGDKYVDTSEPDLVGAAGVRQITFKGLKAGTTKIIFTYEREWEKQPIRTVVVYLTVGKDLKVNAEFHSDTNN